MPPKPAARRGGDCGVSPSAEYESAHAGVCDARQEIARATIPRMARSHDDKTAGSDSGTGMPARTARRRDGAERSRYVEVRLDDVRLERNGRLVLQDVNWIIRPGERWVLAGANGAGKTQLLKLVAGSVWPTPCGHGARQYRWKGDIWRTPHEVQGEIGYVGPERQDKYTRYGWNHTVEQIVATGVHRTDIPLHSLS